MKERIEEKFGCSIEEKMEEFRNFVLDIGPNEADYDTPFDLLTDEEARYVEEYMKSKVA